MPAPPPPACAWCGSGVAVVGWRLSVSSPARRRLAAGSRRSLCSSAGTAPARPGDSSGAARLVVDRARRVHPRRRSRGPPATSEPAWRPARSSLSPRASSRPTSEPRAGRSATGSRRASSPGLRYGLVSVAFGWLAGRSGSAADACSLRGSFGRARWPRRSDCEVAATCDLGRPRRHLGSSLHGRLPRAESLRFAARTHGAGSSRAAGRLAYRLHGVPRDRRREPGAGARPRARTIRSCWLDARGLRPLRAVLVRHVPARGAHGEEIPRGSARHPYRLWRRTRRGTAHPGAAAHRATGTSPGVYDRHRAPARRGRRGAEAAPAVRAVPASTAMDRHRIIALTDANVGRS